MFQWTIIKVARQARKSAKLLILERSVMSEEHSTDATAITLRPFCEGVSFLPSPHGTNHWSSRHFLPPINFNIY